jgi:hypothetical protein
MELGSESRLVTASVTVSPARQRRIGAGTDPLTPVAMRARRVALRPTRRVLVTLCDAIEHRLGKGTADELQESAKPFWAKLAGMTSPRLASDVEQHPSRRQ